MRLGRVPLLGIDYGPAPESQFSSRGAKMYANMGALQAAYFYEELCKMYREGPSQDPAEQEKRERHMQMLASVFGDEAGSVLDSIQEECNPDYMMEPAEIPVEPVKYQPQPAAYYGQGRQSIETPPAASISRIPYGGLWNQAGAGSMWT